MGKRIRVEHGRTKSKMRFAMELIFCCYGLFYLIPTTGHYGIIWTIIAVVSTLIDAVVAFSEKGVPSWLLLLAHRYKTESDEYSIDKSMNELQETYDKGLITSEEYEEKKKKLFDDL